MAQHLEHVTGEGERWDLIAHRYFGSVAMQPALIEANRDRLVARDADGRPVIVAPAAILPAGIVLRVPVIEPEPDESLLPPWKRGRPAPAPPRDGAS